MAINNYDNSKIKISETGIWDGKEACHAYSKPLVNWIANYLKDEKDKLLYDIGCGSGQYLKELKNSGYTNMVGIEGDPPTLKDYENIIKQDLAIPFDLPAKGNCIFLEVAEHVPAQFEKIVLENVVNLCNDKLIMSWATRGQSGHGHVNCLDNYEVIERFTKLGMIYLEQDTVSAKNSIHPTNFNIDAGDLPWFKNTVLIFRKAQT